LNANSKQAMSMQASKHCVEDDSPAQPQFQLFASIPEEIQFARKSFVFVLMFIP
jgi:hypothetical protein